MAISNVLEIKDISRRDMIVYVSIAISIILIVYHFPDYFFLEKATADYAALVLNALGVNVQSKAMGNEAFIDDVKIVKDCTGIQVFAVFLGLLVPVPKASFGRKMVTVTVLSLTLFSANILRIALEFWLVYFGLVPWSLAHYPLSLLLGVLGVLFLVFMTARLLPEFGSLILRLTRMIEHKQAV